jgi:hypothetical protein
MTVRMDMPKLVRNLRGAAPMDPTAEWQGGALYLYQAVYLPYAAGKAAKIGDIDFDRFDRADFETFCDYFNRLLKRTETLRGIATVLYKQKPLSRAAGIFF